MGLPSIAGPFELSGLQRCPVTERMRKGPCSFIFAEWLRSWEVATLRSSTWIPP